MLQLLTLYILWSSITSTEQNVFGYTQTTILTYILGTSLIFGIVLASRSQEIGENINNGDLSTFLIKPWNYFKYWFFRDLGDKAMNILFAVFELSVLFLILRPPVFLQPDIVYLLLFSLSLIIALFLHFFLSCLIGLIGFWSPEVWAPRFLSYILIFFFAGNIFPLDIFPKQIFELLMSLPFPYLLFFPMKIYLGQMTFNEASYGLLIGLTWTLLMYIILMFTWKLGLKKFEAVGR